MPKPSFPWDADGLRRAREARGWTLAQLAAKAGITTGALRSYLYGSSSPGPAVLVRLADALGVATTDLVPLQDPPRLVELRWHAGLSVADVADRVHLTAPYTATMLRAEVRITDPARWAQVLGVDEQTLHRAWEATNADAASRP